MRVAIKLIPGKRGTRSCYRINIISCFKPVVCQFFEVFKVNGTIGGEIRGRPVLLQTSGWIQNNIIELHLACAVGERFGYAQTRPYGDIRNVT